MFRLYQLITGLVLALMFTTAIAVTPQISAGQGGVILRQDGTVWAIGATPGFWPGAMQPVRIFPEINDAVQVNGVGAHYALRANGDLWAMGRNEQGQVGDGTTIYRDSPVLVMRDVKTFSASTVGALVLKTDGSVWAWGRNLEAQLGDGTLTTRLKPVQINGLSDVKAITTGGYVSAALSYSGKLWMWGIKANVPDGDTQNYPWDDPRNKITLPKLIDVTTPFVSVACGENGTLALDTDGHLWSAGDRGRGIAGNGSFDYARNLVQVQLTGQVSSYGLGQGHAVALTNDGNVWTWGINLNGQLGRPASASASATPIKVVLPLAAVEVAAGWSHTMMRTSDGRLMSFGENGNAQLGRGDLRADSVPGFVDSEAGKGHFSVNASAPANLPLPPWVYTENTGSLRGAVPLKVSLLAKGNARDGTPLSDFEWVTPTTLPITGDKADLSFTEPGAVRVFLIGRDSNGLRNATVQTVVPMTPTKPLSISPQLAENGGVSLGLTSTGEVLSWGVPWMLGSSLLLGDGSNIVVTRPVRPGIGDTLKLAVGSSSAYALTSNGLVLSWGRNDSLSLGVGSVYDEYGSMDPVKVLLPKPAIDIAAHSERQSAYAVLLDGSVWAWGENQYGQLGFADTNGREVPTQVPGLTRISKIFANQRGALAIDQDGAVWSWGDNSEYQLGLGDNLPHPGVNRISGLPVIRKVFPGPYSSLALTTSGDVYGWANWHGRLGDMTLPNVVPTPSLMPALAGFTDFAVHDTTLGIKNDGTVWYFGWVGSNQPTPFPVDTHEVAIPPTQIRDIRQPIGLTLVYDGGGLLLSDGAVAKWGYNYSGRIGDGSVAYAPTPTLVSNEAGTGYLSLLGKQVNPLTTLGYAYFLNTQLDSKNGNSLATVITDPRATGFAGDVYFTALIPSNSPLLPKANGFADGSTTTIPVTLGRGGVKQTGPNTGAIPTASGSGAITAGNAFAAYTGINTDPLKGSNTFICMGVTVPELSAKGQVLMRPIANGDKNRGVTQCPTVQTAATMQLYRAAATGSITNLNLTASITPQPEDRGQLRNVYSWAVAPDGTQFMQTGPNQWAAMQEPMRPAMTVTVPQTGDVTLPVVSGINLSSIPGTLVYVGLGSSWAEVKMLNKAGHYYTVQ